jgi:hypothetical protein
MLERLR